MGTTSGVSEIVVGAWASRPLVLDGLLAVLGSLPTARPVTGPELRLATVVVAAVDDVGEATTSLADGRLAACPRLVWVIGGHVLSGQVLDARPAVPAVPADAVTAPEEVRAVLQRHVHASTGGGAAPPSHAEVLRPAALQRGPATERRRRLLTADELEVLRLLAAGLHVPEIAVAMCYPAEDVTSMLGSATRALGAVNGSHAVATALRAELI